MAFVEPVTLSACGVTLLPLALEHEAGLQAAAADGELWNLRITSVPEPENTRKYIEDALAMREAAAHSDMPVMTLTELLDPHSATRLCFGHSPQHMAQVA